MKHFKLLILTAITTFSTLNLVSQPFNVLTDSNRILFLGNSITYQGNYISFIETYLTLKYRGTSIDFINAGLASETVSGLSEPNHAGGAFPRPDLRERLDRVLDATKPDIVLACYGMNDGIYMPFDLERFEKYRDGITWLNDEVSRRGIELIFITPPIYDGDKAGYSNVLDLYADWLISRRFTQSWKVIDIHWQMKKYLEDRRAQDTTFYLAKDGVHPNEQGHWLMAREILSGLNEGQLKWMEYPDQAFENYKNGNEVLRLVKQKHSIMKHAWLSETGHKRPGVPEGLPLEEALEKKDSLNILIEKLVN